MLSINTNISSLIAQNSMQTSTNKLNQAIERMTTGAKINHAKDNAANYSINTNMTTKIGAYQVAEENTAMGMDMVATASENLDQMQNHAIRLRALATQARNGTYGAQSLNAIQSEANAITSEIMRLYNTAQYNGVSLFDKPEYIIPDHLPKAGKSGFIDEAALGGESVIAKEEYNGFIKDPVTYTDDEINAMLASGEIVALDNNVTSFTSGQKYLISNKSELKHLADLVNDNKNSSDAIFILGDDIDLEGEEWTPIGDYSTNTGYIFKGVFDGNGHVIKNLKIESSEDYQGLFGCTATGSEIKNVGIVGEYVKGNGNIGGLVGYSKSSISNCFSTGEVYGTYYYTGGLIGSSTSTSSISNCYAKAKVSSEGSYTGGLVGSSESSVSNCYATGNVSGGKNNIGGLVGNASGSTITNSYATGDVVGKSNSIGGLVGYSDTSISKSYATGDVVGVHHVGGLVGYSNNSSSTIEYSYATGNVSASGNPVGGLIGYSNSSIFNSYSLGVVNGRVNVGGLVGYIKNETGTVTISNSISYSLVTGNHYSSTGSFIGQVVLTSDGVTFGTLDITNCESINQEMNSIGGVYKNGGALIPDYDMSAMLAGISDVKILDTSTNLQVGVHGNSSSRINFNTNFKLDLSAFEEGISSDGAFSAIDDFINLLSEKSTMLGSVSNRLDSVLDEITIQYENLVSSRSTIRDADMAELSSTYIQQQILQQAAATLMATANQSPAIALQLI